MIYNGYLFTGEHSRAFWNWYEYFGFGEKFHNLLGAILIRCTMMARWFRNMIYGRYKIRETRDFYTQKKAMKPSINYLL